MICLNPILKSPFLAAIVTGFMVMLYFGLMTYSPGLPPAALCSAAAAYFVYFMMGGRVLCDESQEPETQLVPSPVATLPTGTQSARTYKLLQ